MIRPLLLLATLALMAAPLGAEEPPAKPPPVGPAAVPAIGKAADDVLAAHAAKDDAAFRALAAKPPTDAWLIADELVRRGEFEAADAFAKSTPRPDTEALGAYVAAQRERPTELARRERLAKAAAAFKAKKVDEALALLGEEAADAPTDVLSVQIAGNRGAAFRALRRWQDAMTAYLGAAERAERLGWLHRAARHLHDAAEIARKANLPEAAADAWRRCLALAERRGDEQGAATTLGNLAVLEFDAGKYAQAIDGFRRARAKQEALGDKPAAALSLGNVATVQEAMGDLAGALATLEQVLAEYEALEDRSGAANARSGLGTMHTELGDLDKAMALLAQALAAQEALGEKERAAETLGRIANVRFELGDFAGALEAHERAYAVQVAEGDRAGAAKTLANIGLDHAARGNHALALASIERALAENAALGSRWMVASCQVLLALVHTSIGDYEQALTLYESALATHEALGNAHDAAETLGTMGNVHLKLGEYDKALAVFERAHAALDALGDKVDAASALANIGSAHLGLGHLDQALEFQQKALVALEGLGDKIGVAQTLGILGALYEARGELGPAQATLQRALEAQEALGQQDLAARTLAHLADVHLALGENAAAVEAARRAVGYVDASVRGLAAEEGAVAREPLSFLYEAGCRAALAADDAASFAFFLESARSGALLEGLRAREALWSAVVSEELRVAEAKARAAETRAAQDVRKAQDTGDRDALKAKRDALGAARAEVSRVIARIQREAKAGAALTYPQADSLESLQGSLQTGEALVLYGLLKEEACALVLTHDGARTVRLGSTAAIEAAVGGLSFEGRHSKPEDPLAALTKLVVTPLGLPPTTTKVLVSPSGALAYVPFALLLPDRTLAYVPSGTTYRLLREEERARGSGVLALGDPDYATKVNARAVELHRGPDFRLVPLPGTRAEALAVGTVRLLGAQATEAGLAGALAKQPRWRAVHLACHGLVDAEHPALSSLAITAAGEDDGFLTCLDVFRMKIPTDLVVLSACETGKGKVTKAEGIVGFTRAFMFAGSPRVICSLWRVDDDATAALMTKFYELWNPKGGKPGLPTAEALRKAQEHVKSQEKWKHPHYWAAWVLWGLPS